MKKTKLKEELPLIMLKEEVKEEISEKKMEEKEIVSEINEVAVASDTNFHDTKLENLPENSVKKEQKKPDKFEIVEILDYLEFVKRLELVMIIDFLQSLKKYKSPAKKIPESRAKKLWMIVKTLVLILRQQTKSICFLAMILKFGLQADVLSLFYPFAVFFYGMLVPDPRPQKVGLLVFFT